VNKNVTKPVGVGPVPETTDVKTSGVAQSVGLAENAKLTLGVPADPFKAVVGEILEA
jgi:hypothetical protein